MYNCEMCGTTTEAGQPIIRHTVKTRNKNYPARDYKGKKRKTSEEDSEFDPGPRMLADPGGTGFETVKEAKVCADCGLKLALGDVPFRPFKPRMRAPVTRGKRTRKSAPVPVVEEITTHQIAPSV